MQLEAIERNDMVVFNFPANDTTTKEYDSAYPYYDMLRDAEKQGINNPREYVHQEFTVITRPVDKRENYIKRCVGIPGDYLELIESILYVNGKPAFVAAEQNLRYKVKNFAPASKATLLSQYGLDIDVNTQYEHNSVDEYGRPTGPIVAIHVNRKTYKKLKEIYGSKRANEGKSESEKTTFILDKRPQYADNADMIPTVADSLLNLGLFPNDVNINNTVTDFQKFQIPYKGQTVKLTKDNIPYFRRIITAYEGHTLLEKEVENLKTFDKKSKDGTTGLDEEKINGMIKEIEECLALLKS